MACTCFHHESVSFSCIYQEPKCYGWAGQTSTTAGKDGWMDGRKEGWMEEHN